MTVTGYPNKPNFDSGATGAAWWWQGGSPARMYAWQGRSVVRAIQQAIRNLESPSPPSLGAPPSLVALDAPMGFQTLSALRDIADDVHYERLDKGFDIIRDKISGDLRARRIGRATMQFALWVAFGTSWQRPQYPMLPGARPLVYYVAANPRYDIGLSNNAVLPTFDVLPRVAARTEIAAWTEGDAPVAPQPVALASPPPPATPPRPPVRSPPSVAPDGGTLDYGAPAVEQESAGIGFPAILALLTIGAVIAIAKESGAR